MTGLLNKHAALVVEDGAAPPADWLGAAGLDWEPVLKPALYHVTEAVAGASRIRAVPTGRVVVRSDTEAALAVVGRAYRPTPQRETLLRAYETLSGQGFQLRCAGALKGGAIPFLEMAAPTAVGRDPLRGSVFLGLRHDLARPVVRALTHRMGCTNMIQSLSSGGHGASHRWLPSTQRDSLIFAAERAHEGAANFSADAERLRNRPMSVEEQVSYLAKVFGRSDADRRASSPLYQAALDVRHTYSKELGENVWAALQCVSHAIDHRPRSSHGRLISAVTGKLAALRERANAMALAYLN